MTEAPIRERRRRRGLALALAAVLVAGAAVGLAFGIPDLAGHHVDGSLEVELRAPAGTPSSVMSRALEVDSRRLTGEGVHGATGRIAGSSIRLSVPASVSPRAQAALVSSLVAVDHLEQREVLNDTPAGSGPAHLTACPAAASTGSACPGPNTVQCPSSTQAGCTDQDLAGRNVTLLSYEDFGRLPPTSGFEHPGKPTPASHPQPPSVDVFRLGPVLLAGSTIANARAVLPPPPAIADVRTPQWRIDFTLAPGGVSRFAQVTWRLVGKRLAIVIDRGVVTAPEITSPITDGQGFIVGRFTKRQAEDLAAALVAGPLPVPLTAARVSPHHEAGSVGAPFVVGVSCLAGLGVLGLFAVRRRRARAA